ncbi:hypothetical protein [[Eubacterium] cellulosolvens]
MPSFAKLMLSSILITLIIIGLNNPVTKAQSIIFGDPADGTVTSAASTNSVSGNFWLGDEASPPNMVSRGFVKFSLAGVSGQLGSATLRLYIEFSILDGVFDTVSPVDNIGLGDTLVVHIDDFGTLFPSDFYAPSIGNDPGILFSSTTNPNVGYISIDVTAAMQDDIDNGRDFTSYMIKMFDDTDGDTQIDEWFFSAADNTGTDQDPIIEYTIVGTVGGVASPVNKFEILTPYLALAGLIAAFSTAYVIRRRKA